MPKKMKKTYFLLGLLLMLLCGCDPISRHKALSTIFDGVPSLPPPEQICTEFAEKKVAERENQMCGKGAEDAQKTVKRESEHPPYAEKNCNGCHNKTTESGFVSSKEDLCYVCHTGFIKGPFVHGPVAVKDCLFCHEPHNAPYPSLLKKEPSQMCAVCHLEPRKTAAMHAKFDLQKIGCVECHNPHYGKVQFFLK